MDKINRNKNQTTKGNSQRERFGPTPNSTATHDAVQNFRRRILRELKKIKLAWKDLNYSTAPGVLILLPSTPTIAPLNQGQLGS